MGPGRPKRSVDQIYEDLEELVRDAIVVGYTDDPILQILIEVTYAAIQSERPIFPNPLHEPILYRKFCKWVKAGFEEAAGMDEAMAKQVKEALKPK